MIFQQALSKKENKGGGGGSPGGDDSDGDIETNLTPRTEAKYNKIDEEFLIHMQHRNHVNGGSRNLQVRSRRGALNGWIMISFCQEMALLAETERF